MASPGKLAPTDVHVARAGEVLGIAGTLLGSGRSELLHALFGADPAGIRRVTIEFLGRPGRRDSPTETSVRRGYRSGPRGPRPHKAIVPQLFDIRRNVSLPRCISVSLREGIGCFSDSADRNTLAAENAPSTRLDDQDTKAPMRSLPSLSGGNAQKVTVIAQMADARRRAASCCSTSPRQGIDIGAQGPTSWRLVRASSRDDGAARDPCVVRIRGVARRSPTVSW